LLLINKEKNIIKRFRDNKTIVVNLGEIPISGPNSYVEIDVFNNEIVDIFEYLFRYWFRFHYKNPEYLPNNTARNNFLAMASVSKNEHGWTTLCDCLGERGLAVYYVSTIKLPNLLIDSQLIVKIIINVQMNSVM